MNDAAAFGGDERWAQGATVPPDPRSLAQAPLGSVPFARVLVCSLYVNLYGECNIKKRPVDSRVSNDAIAPTGNRRILRLSHKRATGTIIYIYLCIYINMYISVFIISYMDIYVHEYTWAQGRQPHHDPKCENCYKHSTHELLAPVIACAIVYMIYCILCIT